MYEYDKVILAVDGYICFVVYLLVGRNSIGRTDLFVRGRRKREKRGSVYIVRIDFGAMRFGMPDAQERHSVFLI